MDENRRAFNLSKSHHLSENCIEAFLKLEKHFNNNSFGFCCQKFRLTSHVRTATIDKQWIYRAYLHTLVEYRRSENRSRPYKGNEKCPNNPVGDIWQDYKFDPPKTTVLHPSELLISEDLEKTQRKEECSKCQNNEQIQCPYCKGRGYIITWTQLNVKWSSYSSILLYNQNFCPQAIIETATNKITCLEFDDVWPSDKKSLDHILDGCNNLPEEFRNELNNNLLAHKKADKILRVKCIIECLRVEKIGYQLNGIEHETFTFYLVGENKKVYLSEYSYPSNSQQCNAVCSLM